MLKKILFFLLAVCASLTAQDQTLSSKIARLQTLPESERYKLMNEIKRELVRLNSRQRSAALGKLRATMQMTPRHEGMKQHKGNGNGIRGGMQGGNGMDPSAQMHRGSANGPDMLQHMQDIESKREFQNKKNETHRKQQNRPDRPNGQNMKHRK